MSIREAINSRKANFFALGFLLGGIAWIGTCGVMCQNFPNSEAGLTIGSVTAIFPALIAGWLMSALAGKKAAALKCLWCSAPHERENEQYCSEKCKAEHKQQGEQVEQGEPQNKVEASEEQAP